MRAKHIPTLLLAALFIPFLLANKNCERSTTWGEKYFGKWEEDHPDIDAETRCVDCHDDITSKKVKPKNHDIAWKKGHGRYATQKYGFRKGDVCALCHDESWCVRCHQHEPPANHTEYWKERAHGAFAGLDRATCLTCHKSADFCERCHALTEPVSHRSAAWGVTTNRHCLNCHVPLSSAGGEQCDVCHTGTPSHSAATAMPSDTLHTAGTNCRTCHVTLRHLDNGDSCATCHTQ